MEHRHTIWCILITKGKIIMKNLERLLYSHMDEQLHFFWAFTLTVIGHNIWPPLILLGLLTTLVKEYWDKYNPPHTWEWRDIAAGTFGWVAGVLCI